MLGVCKFPSPNTNICRKYQRQRGRETERRDMELFPDKYKHLQTRNKQPAITSPAMATPYLPYTAACLCTNASY